MKPSFDNTARSERLPPTFQKQSGPSHQVPTGMNTQESLLDTPNVHVQIPAIKTGGNASYISKKRPPPVPAKPVQMCTNISHSNKPEVHASSLTPQDRVPKNAGYENRPPLPYRPAFGTNTHTKGDVLPQASTTNFKPSLPSRKKSNMTHSDTTPDGIALLDNDVEQNLVSWEPLQPEK